MSALKDFFSFKWLTGSTSQTNAPARQGGGQTDLSGQDRQSRVPSARGESIFAGEASPNKGFPTLIWAFFYAVLISMVVVAVIGHAIRMLRVRCAEVAVAEAIEEAEVAHRSGTR